MAKGPKVLLLDIESAPLISYTWGIWDQNIALGQIKSDWHLLSYAAKWLGEDKIFYQDQRNAKNIENDKELCKGIWKLLNDCDVTITQNGRAFDHKKLNARFILNGMQPPSSFKTIDTLAMAKKHFGFTSNKLEYMSDKLCTKYKKLKHETFSGFELWKECLAGNKKAWNEMEKYNKHDVLALEELYEKLIPWDNGVNFNLYHDDEKSTCSCGGEYVKNGFSYPGISKLQRFRCFKCGSETKGRENLFSKEKKKSLKLGSR